LASGEPAPVIVDVFRQYHRQVVIGTGTSPQVAQ
jgi:hypothetical protein